MGFSPHAALPLKARSVYDSWACVCAHTWVSDSVVSSDKSPAGSTSLREEGKPQQCRTGGRGGWRESGGRGAGRFTSRNESEARQTPRQDADLCGLYILRYKQRSGCTGVAGKEIKQGLYCYRGLFTLPSDLRCCSALAHGLVGSHCNCIQWFQDGQWRPCWLKNATYNPMIRKKTMVFFLLSIIGWGAAAIVTLGLGTCTRIKFFFLLQFIDRKAPISSS